MTLNSAPDAPRKASRLGLIIPWGIAGVLAVGWSLAWLWLAHQTTQRIDAAAATLRADGWRVAWTERRIYGYPFRLDVDVSGLTLADPSGWALTTPAIKSEAYAFAPDRWIVAFPTGLTFTRPDDGPVQVAARRLRFSLNSWDQRPPRLSLEGEDLTFAAPAGAKPFPLARAADLQFYTRAGPDDQGALLLTVTGGAATPGTWLDRLAPGKPTAITVDATFTQASQIHGPSVRGAALRWGRAGGVATIQRIGLAGVDIRAGHVGLGADGQLIGDLAPTLRQLLSP